MAPRGDEPDGATQCWSSLRDPETLRLFVRNLGEGVYVTRSDGAVLDANPACLAILGVGSLDELQSLNAELLIADPHLRGQELAVLERDGHVREFELEIHAADGVVRTVLDTAYRVVDESTGEVFYHGILVDISARKELERQLREAAVRDQLTGCFNRRYLAGMRARLEAEGSRWGIVVIDVDHFKQYNDRYGHLAGDAALARLARFLMQEVRVEDVVVRFGGDEFLVVVEKDAEDATPLVVDRLSHAAVDHAGVDISLGWATRDGDEPFERTIHRADEELFTIRVKRRSSTRKRMPEAAEGA